MASSAELTALFSSIEHQLTISGTDLESVLVKMNGAKVSRSNQLPRRARTNMVADVNNYGTIVYYSRLVTSSVQVPNGGTSYILQMMGL